jgi:hypothetical protein
MMWVVVTRCTSIVYVLTRTRYMNNESIRDPEMTPHK